MSTSAMSGPLFFSGVAIQFSKGNLVCGSASAIALNRNGLSQNAGRSKAPRNHARRRMPVATDAACTAPAAPSANHGDLSAPGRMPRNPYASLLKKQKKSIVINANNWDEDALGSGWSWNDYNESYMNERSPMPIYGNIIKWVQEIDDTTKPPFIYSYPEVNWTVNFGSDESNKNFNVIRDIGSNTYTLNQGKEKKKEQFVPFSTNGIQSTIELLAEPVGRKVFLSPQVKFQSWEGMK